MKGLDVLMRPARPPLDSPDVLSKYVGSDNGKCFPGKMGLSTLYLLVTLVLTWREREREKEEEDMYIGRRGERQGY